MVKMSLKWGKTVALFRNCRAVGSNGGRGSGFATSSVACTAFDGERLGFVERLNAFDFLNLHDQ
jgi:hypothetical protein